ncbi:T9SS type A sorting domain-containing protein [Flavicella sediminum]|uniref:T9SS type A sorting domain-containing protein n=1 Tax=Flavicella sediminum TaxID=2585141 RepID=UPI00111D0F13|nr:T9SS type A sorting domain-containing protein [Flavicella sediminum]
MNHKILNSILGIVFASIPFATKAQTSHTIKPEIVPEQAYHNDGIVSDITDMPTFNPYLTGNNVGGVQSLKIGASAANGAGFTTSAIIPFKLPERPSGKSVTSASLKIHVNYGREWITSNVDLYGLSYNAMSTIDPANHFDDAYPDATLGVTAIEDDFFAKNVAPGNLDTPRFEETSTAGNTALAAYINAQYDAGAVAGDFIFLRLNVDNPATTGAHYFGVDDGSTTNAPTLTLEIEEAEEVEPTPTTSHNVNPTGDGIIVNTANLAEGGTNPWIGGNTIDGTNVLKIGASDPTGAPNTTNAILPFQLPARPEGKLVASANLKINVAYLRHWISSDIDLYGLPYNASNTISPSNFYDGTYPDATGTVTGIQDAYFVRDTGDTEPLGTEILTDREVNSSNTGDTALAAYLNAQYDAGAEAGDYVFLRLSVDATSGNTGAHYYGISDESTEQAPVLTLEIENSLGVTIYEKSTLNIYPNPITNGKATISTEGFKETTTLQIYTLTGQLIHSETLAVDGNKQEVVLNLAPGVYIAKLQDKTIAKTQKLFIK